MPRRPDRLIPVLALAAAVLAVAGCTAASPAKSASPHATPTHTVPALPAALVQAEHLVTQEGLAIALASNVLQSQLQLVQDVLADSPPTSCTALPGGGSHKVTAWNGSASARTLTDVTYFDAACAQQYMSSQATVGQPTDDSFTAQATVAYTSASGAALGSMATNASASLAGSGINLEGTGTFTRSGSGPVSLGLACQSESDTVLDCQGGVTQDFPALGHALGSIMPLKLTLGDDSQNQPLPFQGTGNIIAVAAKGALSVTSPDGVHLAIQGGTQTSGDAATSGQAGSFSLFPPTPTGWTVTDTAGDVSFTINVTDDSSRALAATVTQLSTKKVLATLALDRSGTGTITYGTAKPTPVGGWLLVG